jgi:hypothetical protein
MTNFCTLFNSNYLTRGLALYHSLSKVCTSFHLFIIAFDDNCYGYLKQSGLSNMTVVPLQEFEDKELLTIKPTRSAAEYCWTCTPSVILYCIQKFHLPACTYLDADMIFYNDPNPLLDDMKDCSILLTEHNYTKEYDQSGKNGKYCVQFMCFKNDFRGLSALTWWRERCLEWCFARLEDGKFGDQKYLDDWTERFEGVYVSPHPGGGVAPWNLQKFSFFYREDKLFLREKKFGQVSPVIFFHFHGLKFYTDNSVSCSESLYELNAQSKTIIYFPYIKNLLTIRDELINNGVSFDCNGVRDASPAKFHVFKQFVRERIALCKKGRIYPWQLNLLKFNRHQHFHNLKLLEL